MRSLSNWLAAGQDGTLLSLEGDGRVREIPAISDRAQIVKDYHVASGLCSGERLYEVIRRNYYWFGMKGDCIKYVAQNVPMRVER